MESQVDTQKLTQQQSQTDSYSYIPDNIPTPTEHHARIGKSKQRKYHKIHRSMQVVFQGL